VNSSVMRSSPPTAARPMPTWVKSGSRMVRRWPSCGRPLRHHRFVRVEQDLAQGTVDAAAGRGVGRPRSPRGSRRRRRVPSAGRARGRARPSGPRIR
jgi:hypothetical protein